jgi:ketosteroid isomerase-like protein
MARLIVDRDNARLAEHYTADVVLVAPEGQPESGRFEGRAYVGRP